AFSVQAQPVATGDTGAAIADVTLLIGGVEVPVSDTGGGNYFGTVTFSDAAFTPALDGQVGIEVIATNSRTGGAVARSVALDFVADSDGPVISVSAPVPGQVVGGFLQISASV